MKKFLTGIIACLLLFVGVFTLYGCEPERDFNGRYRLDYAFYGAGSDTPEYKYELADTEVYIEIENTTITEYIYEKNANSNTKRLISMQVMNNLTLPEFTVTKEDGVEYFTNFTNLNRYDEGSNQYKIARWTYVKVKNLPVMTQHDVYPYFGQYSYVGHKGTNLVVNNFDNCSITINGNLTIKDGDTETVYTYVDGSTDLFTFTNGSKKVQVQVIGNKVLKLYWDNVFPDNDYVNWKLDKTVEEL